jgi:ElaB/YqjD/DUF883 family membrane-anchored ribosome-binding protein
MRAANTETTELAEEPTIGDRIADAVRHAAHLSHEAWLVTSMARDAGEEGVHAAKRAMRRIRRHGVEALEDFKEDAAHYVKRQPFKAVGLAFGVGLQLGLLMAWVGGRLGRRCQAAESPEHAANR